ncbi:hypothetical protein HOY82DRAFT_476259, partial [Tuber indicum]
FCHNIICFFTFNLLQMSLFIVLLEGVLSYNPPVRKSAFQPFDRFLIQPPFIATLPVLAKIHSSSGHTQQILARGNRSLPPFARSQTQCSTVFLWGYTVSGRLPILQNR